MAMDWPGLRMLFSYDFWRMAVLWTSAVVYSYFQLLLAARFPTRGRFPTRSYPRCRFSPGPDSVIKRHVCVVTGATSGLGAAAARALAAQGYHVVLAGRCPQLLLKTIGEIKQQDRDASLSAFQVDLSSIRSIKEFESRIKQWLLDSNLHPSIQLLINNAGILATTCRVTSDGYDQVMQTNYIGAFVLTNLLLPLLKISPVPAKIVNVTSFTHRCVSDTAMNEKTLCREIFGCLPTSRNYPSSHTYELSKFCLLLFSYELHRQLHVVDPSPNISVMMHQENTSLEEKAEPSDLQSSLTISNLLKHYGLGQ